MSKKIHLVLTVGKNPLPIWVAWDRLTAHWTGQGHEVAVQFVHTPGSTDEKERLKEYRIADRTTVLDDVETDAREPDIEGIKNQIVTALEKEGVTDLHVHYTGGTQAMGVATAYAMLLVGTSREIQLDMSYLDPGRGIPPATSSPPAVVSWKHGLLIDDTRVSVNVSIQKIAKLNGFRTGPFKSRDKPYDCTAPNVPSAEQLKAGAVVLNNYRGPVEREFRDNFPKGKPWWDTFHNNPKSDDFFHPNDGGCFVLQASNSNWENSILPAVSEAYPSCPWNCSEKKLPYPAAGGSTDQQKDLEKDLEEMDKFFTSHWLEYAAYAAFKKVLESIKVSNSERANFELYHNVYVAQQGDGTADRHSELDVVAVLGYQVVVVSCSVTSNKSDIKQKAMEAYHRARQLGGDEARAVVLCVASAKDAKRVEDELKDETGIERPLQVWGRQQARGGGWGPVPNMNNLHDKFASLCKDDLHWT